MTGTEATAKARAERAHIDARREAGRIAAGDKDFIDSLPVGATKDFHHLDINGMLVNVENVNGTGKWDVSTAQVDRPDGTPTHDVIARGVSRRAASAAAAAICASLEDGALYGLPYYQARKAAQAAAMEA